MKGTGLLGLLPDEFLVLLLAGAGIAMILGFRRTAVSLLLFVVAMVVQSVFAEALLEALPLYASGLLLVLLLFFGLYAASTLVTWRERAQSATVGTIKGTLSAIAWVLRLPFRILRKLLLPRGGAE
jgi:hypothetical protein